jgi:hypothetical protein
MGVRFGALARRAHDGAHRPRTCRTETKTMNSRAPAGAHELCGWDPGWAPRKRAYSPHAAGSFYLWFVRQPAWLLFSGAAASLF